MKIGYYPGCSLEGTAIEYDESLKAVCKQFDIELAEINGWNCCGATAAHSVNHSLSVALPARILALAEKQGFEEVLVPCAACFSRLFTAKSEIEKDDTLKNEIENTIEIDFEKLPTPINMIDFLNKYIIKNLPEKVTNPYKQKVACYYGCLLVRPPKLLGIDNFEDPQTMEAVIRAIGGKTIDWAFKTECCGAGLSISKTDIVAKLSGKILEDATDRGAEAIIVACPMCHSNLDMRRKEINRHLNKQITTPILYITQAIGLALGLSEKELGFHRHFVPVKTVNKIKEKSPAEVS